MSDSSEIKPRPPKRSRKVDQTRLADVVGYRLRLAQLAVFRDFLNTFESMGINPVHYSMLRLIDANPGLRQGELARALGIKRANMVALINGLEERGLAIRKPVANDRRSYSIFLTDEGQAFNREMQQAWFSHEQRMVDRLGGDAEKRTLIALLDRIAGLP